MAVSISPSLRTGAMIGTILSDRAAGVDVQTKLFNGGSPAAEFWRQRVDGARDRWLRGGATDESVNELCRLLQDPSFWTFHSANISGLG